MKKILYILLPAISLTSCVTYLQSDGTTTTHRTHQPPQTDNTPQPDYNTAQTDNNYDPPTDENYDSPTDQIFYDELSPYGNWVDYPDYGYVWVPTDVDADFRPYATNGYWVYSDEGWTWVSNYNWGWAPFHYGRWFYDDNYGWMWMPGQEWAPAWVTWGSYDDNYYCWAPIAPYANSEWIPPAYSWNVVPCRHMTQINVNNYVERDNYFVINHITFINNDSYNDRIGHSDNYRRYNRGPRTNDVERFTHHRIQTMQVTNDHRPGTQTVSNNRISLYRPAFQANSAQSNNRPRRVETFRYENNANRTNQDQYRGQNHNNKPNSTQHDRQNIRIGENSPDGQNHNNRPNSTQQNPQNSRSDNNTYPGRNHNNRPNSTQQNPQNIRVGENSPTGQNDTRHNPPHQEPKTTKPDGNISSDQNTNTRPNRQQRDQQTSRPDGNTSSAQNTNTRPTPQRHDMQNTRPNGNTSSDQNTNTRPTQPQRDPQRQKPKTVSKQEPDQKPNDKTTEPDNGVKKDTGHRGRPTSEIKN